VRPSRRPRSRPPQDEGLFSCHQRLILIGPFDRLFEASREEMSDRRDDSKVEAERIERAHAQRPIAGLRVLSRSRPSTPVSARRYCHRHTVGRLAPALCATRGTEWRSAEASTMRARSTWLRGRLRHSTPGCIRIASTTPPGARSTAGRTVPDRLSDRRGAERAARGDRPFDLGHKLRLLAVTAAAARSRGNAGLAVATRISGGPCRRLLLPSHEIAARHPGASPFRTGEGTNWLGRFDAALRYRRSLPA
jgi:hypothetical protein